MCGAYVADLCLTAWATRTMLGLSEPWYMMGEGITWFLVVSRTEFIVRSSRQNGRQMRKSLLHAPGGLTRAQPPEDGQRRLQPLPCCLPFPLLGVHHAVYVQQAALGIGIGHAPRHLQALLQRLLGRHPLVLSDRHQGLHAQ